MINQIIYLINKKNKLIFIVFILLCSISNVCRAEDCNQKLYFNENKQVTLSGIVRAKDFWGPPGFGEDPKSDSKYTGFLLYLDCPIYADIKKIKLNYVLIPPETKYAELNVINVRIEDSFKNSTDYKLHDGWHAKITGYLNKATVASDQTIIILSNISKTEWANRKYPSWTNTPLLYCTASGNCYPEPDSQK